MSNVKKPSKKSVYYSKFKAESSFLWYDTRCYYEFRRIDNGVFRYYWSKATVNKEYLSAYIHHHGRIIVKEGRGYFEACDPDIFKKMVENVKI